MTKIGYARVSTTDQDTDIQNDRLLSAGCSIVRKEKVSGKSRDGRDELAGIMEFIRAGDELAVVKLDRLGRSTRDVLNLVHELEQKGACLRVLEPEFVTSGDTGRILVTILGWSPKWNGTSYGRVSRPASRWQRPRAPTRAGSHRSPSIGCRR
jgi:DNA invertase Pin-like site-specific DNA recombinase